LNATENCTQDKVAIKPTEFCKAFLLKKTVYRAKEVLQQGLKANQEIVFIPSTAFAARLYTVDLLWQSPDQPNGISLFFCAESSVLEDDHGFAQLEKLDKTDIQKPPKNFGSTQILCSRIMDAQKFESSNVSLLWTRVFYVLMPLKLDKTFRKQ